MPKRNHRGSFPCLVLQASLHQGWHWSDIWLPSSALISLWSCFILISKSLSLILLLQRLWYFSMCSFNSVSSSHMIPHIVHFLTFLCFFIMCSLCLTGELGPLRFIWHHALRVTHCQSSAMIFVFTQYSFCYSFRHGLLCLCSTKNTSPATSPRHSRNSASYWFSAKQITQRRCVVLKILYMIDLGPMKQLFSTATQCITQSKGMLEKLIL